MLEQLKERGTRLVQLRQKLAARTGPDDKPIAGYEENVEHLRKEIERLEKCSLTTSSGDLEASAVASETSRS